MHNKQPAENDRNWLKQIVPVVGNRLTDRVVLTISVGVAVLLWHLANCHFESRDRDRFAFEAAQVRERIVERMAEYQQVLRGGIALHCASNHVSRDEWRSYVDACKVFDHNSGIQAMAVAVVVPASELEQHTSQVRGEGFADYAVHPLGERDLYTSIVLIEPFDWRNKRAFGYDMYSEPVRRLAMERAADTGLPAVSGKTILVQETDDGVQPGILCYLPIYENGANVDSLEARRAALLGWVYAAFRFDNLMEGVAGNDSTDITFKIFDTDSPNGENLLYDSAGNSESNANQHFVIVSKAQLAGRDWTIQFAAKPSFLTQAQTAFGALVAFGGLLLNILLYVVLRSLRQQRESAMELASQMTIGFEHSESRNQLILEHASEAILSVSADGLVLAANSAAHSVFETQSSLLGTELRQLIPELELDDLPNIPLQGLPRNSDIAVRCQYEDGSSFPGRVSIGFLDSNQEPIFVVIVRDETARVEAMKEQEDTNRKLVAASHKAGKAEVATGVLHNVGNAINSVNVSANLLREQAHLSPVDKLSQASAVIEDNVADLVAFFQHDNRAKHFPAFLKQLASSFQSTREKQLAEIDQLVKNVQHIKEIITLQQSAAKKYLHSENVSPKEIFEDAVKMNHSSLARNEIEVIREFETISALNIRKHEVLQILVNLIKNAQQAIEMSAHIQRTITLKLQMDADLIVFSVIDTGVGITEQNVGKMFQHGFTTKETGHGFGLHSSRNTAREMGGTLTVKSGGEGLGATFVLRVPMQKAQDNSTTDDSVEPSPAASRSNIVVAGLQPETSVVQATN